MARKPGRPKSNFNNTDAHFNRMARADRLREATQVKSDRELIDEAISQGRVTKCPPGEAEGALKWPTGGKKS